MTADETPHDDAHKDIGCLKALEMFYAYLDGELDPTETADFEHHMAHCKSCYSRAELEGLITERLKKSAKRETPESLKRRLRILLDHL